MSYEYNSNPLQILYNLNSPYLIRLVSYSLRAIENTGVSPVQFNWIALLSYKKKGFVYLFYYLPLTYNGIYRNVGIGPIIGPIWLRPTWFYMVKPCTKCLISSDFGLINKALVWHGLTPGFTFFFKIVIIILIRLNFIERPNGGILTILGYINQFILFNLIVFYHIHIHNHIYIYIHEYVHNI